MVEVNLEKRVEKIGLLDRFIDGILDLFSIMFSLIKVVSLVIVLMIFCNVILSFVQ